MLTAILHIGGSIILLFLLSIGGLWLAAWEGERSGKRRLREAANDLGVALEELESETVAPRLIELSSARFSSELFRNRLSDLCGVLRTAWGWLGSMIQVIIYAVVIWVTFSDNVDNAVYAWTAVATWLLFSSVSIAFSLVCYFITGRYPGEAKQARKALNKFLEERKDHQRGSTGPLPD